MTLRAELVSGPWTVARISVTSFWAFFVTWAVSSQENDRVFCWSGGVEIGSLEMLKGQG